LVFFLPETKAPKLPIDRVNLRRRRNLLVLVGWWAEKQSFNCPYQSNACRVGSWTRLFRRCGRGMFRKTIPVYYSIQ